MQYQSLESENRCLSLSSGCMRQAIDTWATRFAFDLKIVLIRSPARHQSNGDLERLFRGLFFFPGHRKQVPAGC